MSHPRAATQVSSLRKRTRLLNSAGWWVPSLWPAFMPASRLALTVGLLFFTCTTYFYTTELFWFSPTCFCACHSDRFILIRFLDSSSRPPASPSSLFQCCVVFHRKPVHRCRALAGWLPVLLRFGTARSPAWLLGRMCSVTPVCIFKTFAYGVGLNAVQTRMLLKSPLVVCSPIS